MLDVVAATSQQLCAGFVAVLLQPSQALKIAASTLHYLMHNWPTAAYRKRIANTGVSQATVCDTVHFVCKYAHFVFIPEAKVRTCDALHILCKI